MIGIASMQCHSMMMMRRMTQGSVAANLSLRRQTLSTTNTNTNANTNTNTNANTNANSNGGFTTAAALVTSTISTNGVATITLNDPDRLNALTAPMGDQLTALVRDLQCDQGLRACVLTGAGKAFSSGGDLDFLEDRTRSPALENAETMRAFYDKFLVVRTMPVPVIAAINGAAIGAGLCLAAACDMRVVAESAKLGWTFATLGLHPGMAATHFTPQLLGTQTAASYLLTGRIFNGTKAVEMGLALEAHADTTSVLPAAQKLAEDIAAASPVAVRACTKSLRLGANQGLERALSREADCQAHSYASADMLEGLAAVRERRRPKF